MFFHRLNYKLVRSFCAVIIQCFAVKTKMWLLLFQLCKPSQFLILLVVSSALLIVDAGARNSWTDQSNSTSASNESEVTQIDEFPPATDDGLKAVDWSAVWPYFNTGCLEWLPINHVYFQLANSFLFLSYLAPAGLYGLIYLRLTLAIGSAFLSIWGWIIICAFDTFLWNALFFAINAVHAVVLLISLRPMALDAQVEQVYRNLFKPLKVSKQQFKKVAKCVMSIRPIKRGEYFAVEQETAVETLSLLLSGIMLVIERGKTLHVLSPMQFLDSPDWFDDSCDHFYQESIRACEESRVLLWHRDKLQAILQKDLFLQSVFNQILGRDLVQKLSEASRNTNIVKAKGFSEMNGSTIENEKSQNGKPSGKENTAKRDQQAGLASAPEQLSLLNDTVAKNVNTYSLNNKRQFSR